MRRLNFPGFALIGSLAFCLTAQAGPGENPYKDISAKNPFRLNPPPPPAPVTATPAEEEVTVLLTGITSSDGVMQAWFSLAGKDGKSEYMTLKTGQRQGIVEVVKITPDMVEIMKSGRRMPLNLKDNSPRVGPGVAPAGFPKVAGLPTPPPNPYQPATANYDGSNRMNVSTNASGQIVYTTGDGRGYTRPSRIVPVATDGTTATVQDVRSPEEAVILNDLQRRRNQAAVDNGQLPPLPTSPPSYSVDAAHPQEVPAVPAPPPRRPGGLRR